MLGALAVSLLLLEILGFMVTTTLFMAVVVFGLGVRSWRMLAAVPLLSAGGALAGICGGRRGARRRGARRGGAGPALTIAAIGSFIAGTFSVVMLTLLAPPIAEAALRFGPPEYFALMLLGLP